MTRFLLAVLALLAAVPANAEPTTARVRGTVAARAGDVLTIRSRGGGTVTVRMDAKTRVFAAVEGRVRDIKPESYVSVVTGPDPGSRRAERVTLYSPSERGFEAGRRPWDSAPGAILTAGWIADIDDADPRRVTLTYGGGQTAFEVPRTTPVTQISPGEKTLLEPGAPVTAFTHAAADGTLQAGTVVVGRQGAVPTL